MMARLGDIASYINGYAFKPDDWSDEGRPIIRIQDLTGNSYQANRFNGICPEKYNVTDGDILISWSASLGIFVWHGEDAVLNQHIFKVVFDKAEVDRSFFIYQVENILENAANETHGATMKHLTKPIFDALPFTLPTIEEQQRIARKLDSVTQAISLRKQQLAKLDKLVKSQFVEMFGDCIENDHKWVVKPLCDVLVAGRTVTYGIVQTEEDVPDGVPVFRPVDISQGHIPTRNELKRTKKEISDRYKRTLLSGNELLITVRGSVGETFQTSAEFAGCNVARNIVPLESNPQILDQAFLKAVLDSTAFQRKLAELTKGAALKGINMNEFKLCPIILPALELQKQYVSFVAQADKSKLAVQQSLEKLETLRKSLMQRYFG